MFRKSTMKAMLQWFQAITQPEDFERQRGLKYWRELIISRLIQILLVLGFFSVIISIWFAARIGLNGIVIVDVLAYMLLVSFIFLRNVEYRLRAILFLLLGFSLGTVGFFASRDAGAALLWVFCIPPIASLLLGGKGGIVFWLLNTAFVLGTELALLAGVLAVPGLTDYSPAEWGLYALNFTVTNLVVTLLIGLVLNGLTRAAEQAQMSEGLAEHSEARYRALFEGMLDGFAFHKIVVDDTGQPIDYRFLEVNKAFEELTGLKDVVGRFASEAIPGIWESNPELLETYGRVAASGSPEHLEVYVAPLGSWFAVSAYSLDQGYFATIFENITQQKRAEEDIAALSKFPTENPNPVLRIGKHGRILFANEAGERMLAEREARTGSLLEERWRERAATVLEEGEPAEFEARLGTRTYLMFAAPVIEQGYVNVYGIDITKRLLAEKQLSMVSRAVESSGEVIFLTDTEGTITYVNSFFTQLYGYLASEVIGKTTPRILKSGVQSEATYRDLWGDLLGGRVFKGEFINRAKDGRLIPVSVSTSPVIDSDGKPIGFLSVQRDVSERKRAEAEIKQRLAELEAIASISAALRAAATLDEMMPALLDTTLDVMNASRGTVWLYDEANDYVRIQASRGIIDPSGEEYMPAPERPGEGLAGKVFASGKPYLSSEFQSDPNIPESLKQHIPAGIGGVAVPIHSNEQVLGVISITSQSPSGIDEASVVLLSTLADIAGNAIQRTMLFERRERALQKLSALRDIDRSILSKPMLADTLDTVIDNVLARLEVDAATIMLFEENKSLLRFSVSKGFKVARFTEKDSVALGQGFAGQVIAERQFVHVTDLQARQEPAELIRLLAEEDFQSYLGVPLIAKDKVVGVLEIFHRAQLPLDSDWVGFLEALAGQASIAIESASLFSHLQESNARLRAAYDSTIEGWSRALDLRDHETEGHSQRVAGLSVQLAKALGVNDQDLVRIRRGALLHDIGKMGIPDSILMKPDSLTEEEWEVMRRHPILSRDMLDPITYLQGSLDIPYRHHERWDGSGYPDGLKGEEIPVAARIFAVADVYDALTSDRPYRPAWSEKKAVDYIREQSGKLFEPRVVDAFLELV